MPQQAAEDVVLPQFEDEPMWVPSGRPQLTEQAKMDCGSPEAGAGGPAKVRGGRAREQTHRWGVGTSQRRLAWTEGQWRPYLHQPTQ